jgi:hypothetical protein
MHGQKLSARITRDPGANHLGGRDNLTGECRVGPAHRRRVGNPMGGTIQFSGHAPFRDQREGEPNDRNRSSAIARRFWLVTFVLDD